MSAPAEQKITLTLTDLLVILDRTHLDACPESRRWIEGHPDLTTPAQLWASCERGDHMLWLAIRTTAASRWRPLAYACADRAVRVYAPKALEAAVVRMEMAGKDTKAFRDHAEQLRGLARVESSATTREAARAARAAWAAWAAWDAAGAVGAAARAARAAAWAAEEAAGDAAWAAAWAAAGAAAWAAAGAVGAAEAAEAAELRFSGEEIRAAIPWSEIEAALADADAES